MIEADDRADGIQDFSWVGLDIGSERRVPAQWDHAYLANGRARPSGAPRLVRDVQPYLNYWIGNMPGTARPPGYF